MLTTHINKYSLIKLTTLFDRYCIYIYGKTYPLTDKNLKEYLLEVYNSSFDELPHIEVVFTFDMIEINYRTSCICRDTIIDNGYRGVNYFFRLEEFDKKIDEYTREFK